MNTQLILVADERGFTVQLSTNHQTQTGTLAHFTEVLAQLHHQHPATKADKAAIMASTATPGPTAATDEASSHEQSISASTRPHLAYRNLNNRGEEPSF